MKNLIDVGEIIQKDGYIKGFGMSFIVCFCCACLMSPPSLGTKPY